MIRKAQRAERPLDEDKIWNIFLQITSALHHCHCPDERSGLKTAGGRTSVAGVRGHQVLHRDLKPENVFLSDDFVKLGDFGLSKDMGNAAFTSTYVGVSQSGSTLTSLTQQTPLYMPPEILQENRYDTKSDIWSLGCLVFELCTLAYVPNTPIECVTEDLKITLLERSDPRGAHPYGQVWSTTSNTRPYLSTPQACHTIHAAAKPCQTTFHRRAFGDGRNEAASETFHCAEPVSTSLTLQTLSDGFRTALVIAKRDELKSWEEKLVAQSAALSTREEALAAREAFCSSKEEENRETQRKLNVAAEALRGQWDRLRGERDQARDPLSLGLPLPFDRGQSPALLAERA